MGVLILNILKIAGLILLFLILFLLLVLFLILFVPIRYRIRAQRDARTAQEIPVDAKIKVTWLLHAVSAAFHYPAEAYLRVKVLGITIFRSDQKKEDKKKETKKKKSGKGSVIPTIFWVLVWIPMIINFFSSVKGMISGFFVYGSTLGIGVIEIIRFFDEDQEGEKGKQQPLARAACVLCALAAVAITFFHPVSDLYYYGCTVAIFGVILYRFVEVIRNYNRIAMRRLPQFDRQGGDDRA